MKYLDRNFCAHEESVAVCLVFVKADSTRPVSEKLCFACSDGFLCSLTSVFFECHCQVERQLPLIAVAVAHCSCIRLQDMWSYVHRKEREMDGGTSDCFA